MGELNREDEWIIHLGVNITDKHGNLLHLQGLVNHSTVQRSSNVDHFLHSRSNIIQTGEISWSLNDEI